MERVRWLGMALAGGVLAVAFPPFPDAAWPCLLLALAYWFSATRNDAWRISAGRTFLFMFVFFLVLLRWMRVVGTDAWIVLSALEAAFFIPVGIARARLRQAAFAVPAMAAVWILADIVRDHMPGLAFGWGQLAFSSIDAPWAAAAPWLGQYGVGFVAATTAFALGSLRNDRLPNTIAWTGVGILCFSLPLALPRDVAIAHGVSGTLGIVQAGVQHTGLGFLGDPRDVTARLRNRTLEESALQGVDLIVWPENAADVDPHRDARSRQLIVDAARQIGRPLLLGAVLEDGAVRRNATLLATPNGALTTEYMKQRLVPFGEYLPLRTFMEWLTERATLLPKDFEGGTTPGHLRVGPLDLAVAICFEVADESIVNGALDGSGTALVVQTNNATYAGLGQSDQQLRIAQLRALTFGVPVYVSSTTGPSAVIGIDGRVVRQMNEGNTGILLAAVPSTPAGPAVGRVQRVHVLGLPLLIICALYAFTRRRVAA